MATVDDYVKNLDETLNYQCRRCEYGRFWGRKPDFSYHCTHCKYHINWLELRNGYIVLYPTKTKTRFDILKEVD